MKKTWKIALAALCATAAMVQTSQAVLITDTLADLVTTHGTLGIGDKIFSGFTASATGLNANYASQINVTASIASDGTYLLTYSGGGLDFASLTPASGDLALGYNVTATGGHIFAIDQAYAGNIQGLGNLSIDETVTSAGAPTATSHLAGGVFGTDPSDPSTYPTGNYGEVDLVGLPDQLFINPAQSTVSVIKDIHFNLFTPGDISLSVVQQSYHQTAVPEATTVIAAALLLLPFGASTLKIIRKNRTA